MSVRLCLRTYVTQSLDTSLGNGITDVIVIQEPKIIDYYAPSLSLIPDGTPSTVTTLILTYDNVDSSCINLPVNILHKTATDSSDVYETMWTIKQKSRHSDTADSSDGTNSIRLLAVSACTITNSWCIAKVKHGSNDVDIIQVSKDSTMKQLAHIKGPAKIDYVDVIGAMVLQTNSMKKKVQLIVAFKHDSTMRVYDIVHGRELCRPISISISGDSIADIFVDTDSKCVFTTSTWLSSVHCWSLDTEARNKGDYMIDIANAELVAYKKQKQKQTKPVYEFKKLMACIQQQPPTLLESLKLV
jgi:hypothetical protein